MSIVNCIQFSEFTNGCPAAWVMLTSVMAKALPQLRTVSIRDGVVDILRDALLAGRFRPAESLSEPELAAQLNVSRGPVREALLVLVQEGLVLHSQNRGFSVVDIKPDDATAMAVARLPLEVVALKLAKKRITRAELDALRRLKRSLMKSFACDLALCAREDLSFHEKIWEAAGNPWVMLALRRIAIPFFSYSMMFKEHAGQLTSKVLDEQHQCYLDYLEGSTSLSAEECVRFHLSMYIREPLE